MVEAPPSEFLDVHGVRTHVRQHGSGPAVLLLHGSGGSGAWSPYYDALAQRFRLIVPDHPGFGTSERPDWLETMDDMVYHYLDLLELLDVSRASVVGSSIGGWMAAELAVAHPEVVERLALVDPVGLKIPGMFLPDMFSMAEDDYTRLLYHDQELAEKAIAAPRTSDALLQRIKNLTTVARLAWNPYLYSPRLGRRLYRITAPTAIIWGQGDRLIPIENAQLWLEGIPHATLTPIENCGHVPHRERPQELTRLVLDFLTAGA
jgi:pimeloyl-ACP methyl ester carboxylesterase